MNVRYDSPIVDMVCRAMVPFIQLFALYVLAFGHYSPGGGFQAGAILAGSILLSRLCLGKQRSYRQFPPAVAPILAAVGLLIYSGIGLIALLSGGPFLDYGSLPLPGFDTPMLRYLGILGIEIGVALGVFGIMVTIFDSLVEG